MFPKTIRTNIDKLKNDIASLEAQLLAMDKKHACACPPTKLERNVPKIRDKTIRGTNNKHPVAKNPQNSNRDRNQPSNITKNDCPCSSKRLQEKAPLGNVRSKGTCPCKATNKNAKIEGECCDCDCPAKHKKPPFYLGTVNPVPQVLPKTKDIGTIMTDRSKRDKSARKVSCDDCDVCPFKGYAADKCPCGKEKETAKANQAPCDDCDACPFRGNAGENCPCRKETAKAIRAPCDDCGDCPFAAQERNNCPCPCGSKVAERTRRNDRNVVYTVHKENHCPCSRGVSVKSAPLKDCPFANQPNKDHGRISRNQDHYHHQICIPLDILKSPKRKECLPEKDKGDDGNSTWREILTKNNDSKKLKDSKCKCSSKPKKLKSSEKSKEAEILTKELEIKNLAIRNMQKMLEKHEKGEAILKSLVTNLQDELVQLQEGHGRAKLENLLKALEEEKLKVLLAGKDVVLDHVLQCNEEIDERLRKQREFDRNVSAGLEIEKILMALQPEIADLTADVSTGRGRIHPRPPPQTSTPTGSAESLDGFANESWVEISKIDNRMF